MLRVIGFFFRSSWQVIVLAGVASALAAASNLYALKLLGEIVSNDQSELFVLLGYISLLIIASSVITLFNGKYVTKYFENKVANYRKELTEKSLLSKYDKIEKKLDKLVPILLFETSVIGGFGKGIPDLLVAIFQSTVVLAYLFKLSWVLTISFLPIFLVVTITNFVTLSWFKKIEKSISDGRFKLHFALDTLEKGFKDLIVNKKHSQSYIKHTIDEPNSELVNLSVKNVYLRTLIDKSQNAFVIISLGFLLVYAMSTNAFGQNDLIEYMALILYIRPSLNKIANFTKQVKGVENALEQVESLDIDIKESRLRSEDSIDFDEGDTQPLINASKATYAFGGTNSFKLDTIDFEIRKNEIVIINGSNGSGKSTLFKLLIGLYTPQKGNIEFQGEVITKRNVQSYRRFFSCYFTDSPLFVDFRYLITEENKPRFEELIEYLGLKNKAALDENQNLVNINVSHGQRGRLNLLRLLLEDREIYFLDEWAANQDIHFKEKFYNEIVPDLKKKGKTIILISHDDKFYSVADRVITLKNGKIDKITTTNEVA
ncbi:ATP-binding cassette domain-containing protein [Ekhidna sp.]|uniref:ATP-binding cassette domain-containing protein n=1 Tax=Ekhidna sp. TaxID=2608089 RepID=UPI003CCBFB63